MQKSFVSKLQHGADLSSNNDTIRKIFFDTYGIEHGEDEDKLVEDNCSPVLIDGNLGIYLIKITEKL